MSSILLLKLLAIFLVVALGYWVGRMRWLGEGDPARVLSNAAFYIFVPALLFRTTSRIQFADMPWRILVAYFVPVLCVLMAVYLWQRYLNRDGRLPVAAPSVRAISATFGNTLQIGVPVITVLFGEAGLSIHITIVGLHALILLSVLTALVEQDLARHAQSGGTHGNFAATMAKTVRNTLIHPVVLPVMAGLVWNALGLALPTVVDEVLVLLGGAVVPLCLVLIGVSLAYYGLNGAAKGAVTLAVLKMVALPTLVLVTGHWIFGLSGLALSVLVMVAAMPIGSNALLFSQRYAALEGEVTAAVVISTFAFAVIAPIWLWVLTYF